MGNIDLGLFLGFLISPSWLGIFVTFVQYLAEKRPITILPITTMSINSWTSKYSGVARGAVGVGFLDAAVKIKDHHIETRGPRIFFRQYSAGVFIADRADPHFSWPASLPVAELVVESGGFLMNFYMYFPLILKATSLIHFMGIVDKPTGEAIGLQLIYTGIAIALFLALLQKILKGSGRLPLSIQVFADVFSYLRLYALGLAGAIMAETFNEWANCWTISRIFIYFSWPQRQYYAGNYGRSDPWASS